MGLRRAFCPSGAPGNRESWERAVPKLKLQITKKISETYDVDGAVTIGRADTNDIVLLDSAISRVHAVIHKDKDRFAIVDNNSSNGVLVNGAKITRLLNMLDHGDERISRHLQALEPPLWSRRHRHDSVVAVAVSHLSHEPGRNHNDIQPAVECALPDGRCVSFERPLLLDKQLGYLDPAIQRSADLPSAIDDHASLLLATAAVA